MEMISPQPSSLFTPLPWQEPAWRRLAARLENASLPHALLISGAAGTGKLHFARAFAALALCRQPENARACGQCNSCHQFAAAHPDYHLLTIPEDKTAILVDQIRELAQSLALTSQHAGRKVALLAPADAMNSNAANSLLKTLEEPSGNALLLLVSARPSRLPATIRSRCQAVRIVTPATGVAMRWLDEREPRPDWPALLGLAGGGPLLALELAQHELLQERLGFYRMLDEMRNGRRNPVSCAAEASRKDLPLVLRLLQTWVADLIILASTGDSAAPTIVNADAPVLLQNALRGITLRGLHAYLSRLNAAVALASTPVNGQLLLEGLFIDWSEGLQTLELAPLAAHGG